MSNPMILSDNLFDDAGTLSASDTDTDSAYSVDNIKDLRPYTWWKAANATTGAKWIKIALTAAATADSLGIIGHNLSTAGVFSFKIEHSPDNSTWTTVFSLDEGDDELHSDKAFFVTFTAPAVKGYWRILIEDDTGAGYTAVPQIAVIMLGTRIDMPTTPDTPFDPGKEKASASVISNGGNLLGSVYRFTTTRITAVFAQLTRTFVWNTLYPWWTSHAKLGKPFFFVWDYANYATDVRWVKLVDGAQFERPLSRGTYVDSFTLDMEGMLEE
jgi:hypothetical protein